jgi:hypothetical protein
LSGCGGTSTVTGVGSTLTVTFGAACGGNVMLIVLRVRTPVHTLEHETRSPPVRTSC